MPHLLGRFRTGDLQGWKRSIDKDRDSHARAGIRFQQVWTRADDAGEIFFLFDVDDLDRARTFLDKAGALDEEKQRRGEIPELFFLEAR